jgi:two-component system KDP operon response regulator KdpE
MHPKPRILVVDDEPQIARVLRTGLASHGYDVRAASDGSEALGVMAEWSPDLVVTDLAMPGMSGTDLCRRIRAAWDVPIIVLSARREESAKVDALDAGADDYMTKPFGMGELLARVRAALRRASAEARPAGTARLEAGDLCVDLEARIVTIGGTPVRLTPKEYDLLVYMMRNAGKVLTHAAMLRAVWGGESAEQVEYLRVFVGQLRKKIEPDPSRPRYIVTEPWIGYRFDPGA